MEIRKASIADLESILKIYEKARQYMVQTVIQISGLKITGRLKIWLKKT